MPMSMDVRHVRETMLKKNSNQMEYRVHITLHARSYAYDC